MKVRRHLPPQSGSRKSLSRHAARLIAGGTANHDDCFVRAPAKRTERHPRLGELHRVHNANPDRKSHKPRRPNRRALMPVDLSRHSEISSHGSLRKQWFLRSIMVKLRSRPAFHDLMRQRGCVSKPSPRTITDEPSCLITWTHSGPDCGRATFDGWHGSMKPVGRRTIMIRG